MTSGWLSRALSTMAMSVPFAVWAVDSVFSLSTVRGTSMEPSLRDGDIVLVRKADILPLLVARNLSEEDMAMRARIWTMETGGGGDVQEQRSMVLFARPPMVLPGDVIVFCSPKTAFPNEYHIKRVMAVGGQMIPIGNSFHRIQLVPQYHLWLTGDNTSNSEDSRTYGSVSKKLLVGKAELVVWPPSRWGRVEKIVPPKGRAWWRDESN